MKRLSTLLLAGLLAVPLHAQAPSSTFLWKLADQTLARPAALAAGPTGIFWNPARPIGERRLATGIQLVRAPDIVGIDGLVVALEARIVERFVVGVMAGRLDMRDIIRTTSSPVSQLGTIPIYDQVAAVSVAGSVGPAVIGVTIRGHDSRFDIESETGVTTDFGLHLAPIEGLSIGASTHLQSYDGVRGDFTEYLLGASYRFGAVDIGPEALGLSAHYGAAIATRGRVDQTFGVDVDVNGVLSVTPSITREEGFESSELRPTVEVVLTLGRYNIGIARSEGLNGLGATYRIAFDLVISP